MMELLTVDGKLFSKSCIVPTTASNTCTVESFSPFNSGLETAHGFLAH